MTREPFTSRLSDEQRHNICLLLSTGCDREAAATFARCSPFDIQREMLHDPDFAADVRHAEARSELAHIRNVQNAAQDVKNWRASVWWLERRLPERFGRRAAETITTRQLQAFIAQLAASVFDAIQDPGDRERLMERLEQMERSLQAMSVGSDELRGDSTPAHNPMLLEEVEVDSLASPEERDLESDVDVAK
jgi:hypothetical protein